MADFASCDKSVKHGSGAGSLTSSLQVFVANLKGRNIAINVNKNDLTKDIRCNVRICCIFRSCRVHSFLSEVSQGDELAHAVHRLLLTWSSACFGQKLISNWSKIWSLPEMGHQHRWHITYILSSPSFLPASTQSCFKLHLPRQLLIT